MIIKTYSEKEWLDTQALLIEKEYQRIDIENIKDSYKQFPCVRIFNSIKTFICTQKAWDKEEIISAKKFISYAHKEF